MPPTEPLLPSTSPTSPLSSPSPLSSTSPLPTIHPTSLLKQLAIVAVTLIQGLIQPYWTFKHLYSVESELTTLGNSVLELRDRYEALTELFSTRHITLHPSPLPVLHSAKHAVSEVMLHPMYFRMAWRYLGALEVRIQLMSHPDIYSVRWVRSPTPLFRIRNTFDIQVPSDQRKTLSVSLDKKRHALLTGPNKGGKSTALRAIGLSALLAHTYGCSVGELEATPFHRLFICLKPDDLPGTKSRFEREIEFTAETLSCSTPILVLLDELYHSTNPPDALHSCKEYSKRLWASSNVVSIISTHLFDWVEQADPSIQRLCCPAYYDTNKNLHFTYQLEEGICTVSSVELLLRKNGLCA
jgi:hypothetical protein